MHQMGFGLQLDSGDYVCGWLGDGKCLKRCGGPGRVRTVDLFHAMEARSQLRHRPNFAADRQTPDRENSTLAGTRFQKALQGHWSATEYSTSARRSANCSLLYPLPTMK